MKLVTWNCQGAFRKKAEAIATFAPDIAVIQECESPEKLRFKGSSPLPYDFIWFGDHPSKGVGIFSYTGAKFQVDGCYDPTIKHCIPICVSGTLDLHLIAIWAMGDKEKARSYVGQVYHAVERYWEFIQQKPTLLIGDWNSNAIWDKERKVSNHSAIVRKLAEIDIVSSYHEYFGEAHGKESQMTFFLYRDLNWPYHLDYCFVPRRWMSSLTFLQVGGYEEWRRLSDHTPLFLEFQSTL